MEDIGQADKGRQLMERLLDREFGGRDELRAQLLSARIKTVVSRGSPAFLFGVQTGVARAPVKQRVPVEAQALDVDGVRIHMLVHVRDGLLTELELHREDGEAIVRIPAPSDLQVTVIG